MGWAAHRGQQIFFLLLLLSAGLAAQAAYPLFNARWLAFHEAEKAFSRGDFAQAAQEYRRAQDQGVDTPGVSLRLGESLISSGQFNEARSVFEDLLSRRPGLSEAMAKLSGLYDQLGEPERARALYKEADRRGKLTFSQLVRWADLLKRQENYTEAEKVYTRALDTRPGSTAVLLRLAEMMAWQKRYAEAEKVLEAVLSADPNHRQANLHLARLLAWQGRNQEAIDRYRQALGETP